MLKPHRDSHITTNIHLTLERYLTSDDSFTLHLCHFDRAWPGTPSTTDIRNLHGTMNLITAIPKTLAQQLPRLTMWEKICVDYTPSTHPSHIACTTPTDSTPPPAICVAAASYSRLISSTIFRLAVAHCFDANYSDRFHPNTDDVTTCPCTTTPCLNPHQRPHHPARHTRNHVIFHCPLIATNRIPTVYTLRTILQLEEHTTTLCTFLKDTNSSLFRPLPRVEHPSRDPP